MATRMIRGLVLCAVVAGLLSGCRPATPVATQVSPATEVRARSGDLELKMTILAAEVPAGMPLVISLLLRNVGRADRVLRSVSPALFDAAVYAADGTVIRRPLSARRLLARPAIRVLRPGEAAAASIVWDGMMTTTTGTRVRVPAGEYLLEGYAVWTAPETPLLKTPRLAVQVRE